MRGALGGKPAIGDCIEWLDDGGDKLDVDMFEGGSGRGGPVAVLAYALLVLGGG